jgi:hypothetical protein
MAVIPPLRFRKLYEDFKPELNFWKLVLLVRKFCIAIIATLLSEDPMLQVNTQISLLLPA